MSDTPTAATASPGTARSLSRSYSCSPAERAALDLWTDLMHVTGWIRGRVTERLAAGMDLLPEEVELLMELEAAPEQRLRMADVSRSLRLSKSGVTRLVDRLALRGLVERAPCPSDRRVVYAGLTEAGRRAVDVAAPLLISGVAEQLGGHLEAQELEDVTRSLRKVLAAHDAA